MSLKYISYYKNDYIIWIRSSKNCQNDMTSPLMILKLFFSMHRLLKDIKYILLIWKKC